MKKNTCKLVNTFFLNNLVKYTSTLKYLALILPGKKTFDLFRYEGRNFVEKLFKVVYKYFL